ncbi:MAG: CAP domain-containing protein, partial [Candidatus Micrarchaeota archaeon]|nr:CAP domain-containing protein [Candidatus Micrarchaeota archaeon]
RKEYDLDALTWNERAASAARKYAQALVVEKRFAHTGADGSNIHDRLRAEGLLEFVANENLAQVSFNGTLPSAEKVVDGWMKSPGHRSNIIDVDRLYDHAGVGTFCDADVCVFAYTAAGLTRHGTYTLNEGFYSFVYLNDPGYGFERTVRMKVNLSAATGVLDAYVLPDSRAFEAAKNLPAERFQQRDFPYVQKYENTHGFSDALNASVGFGLMVINTENRPVSFELSIGLPE